MHACDAPLKVSPLLVDRSGEQKIANRVPPRRARLSGESEAQEIRCSRFRVREGNKTVAQVTNRWNPELLSQHPGRSTVVPHGDNRRQVRRLKLEAAQRSSESGTAAKHHHAPPSRQAATALKQFEQRDAWSIRSVRQDCRPRQPNEPYPHQEQAQQRCSCGTHHGIEIT
jgi:hypothetical protein